MPEIDSESDSRGRVSDLDGGGGEGGTDRGQPEVSGGGQEAWFWQEQGW